MGRWRQLAQNYGVALQRSGKDARARKFLVSVTLSLVYLLVVVIGILYFYFVLIPSGNSNRETMLAMYAMGAISLTVTILIARNSTKNRSHHVALGDALRTSAGPQDGVATVVREYLEERAMILSSLIARAASEAHVRVRPGETHVASITRQAQNSILRDAGVWDKLEPQERDPASSADGTWSEDQQAWIAVWCEQLRLMRWVLGLDVILTPLALFPKADFALTQGLAARPTGGRVRESWEVRVERDAAAAYVNRIMAEQQHRGLLPHDAAVGNEAWAQQLRERHAGDSRDLLAGSKTVAELDDNALQHFSGVVLTRWRYASYLVEQLSRDQPLSLAAWEAQPAKENG